MGSTCMTLSLKKETPVTPPTTNKRLFITNIRDNHKYYVKLVLHTRQTRLFQSRTDRLVAAVHKYFQNSFNFDSTDLDIGSIDAVRKLHPHDYWNTKIDEEWLIAACLRQQKFADETRVEKITFDHAFPEYLQFLRLCRYNFIQKNGNISVPTKCQDVIWHSHMLDPENYKKDMLNFMGKLLNHKDDYPEDELKRHALKTKQMKQKLREQLNPESPNMKQKSNNHVVSQAKIVSSAL